MIDDKLIAKVRRASQYREVVPAIFERMNSIVESDLAYVYVAFCEETGLFKIGMSTRPERRLKELAAKSAYVLKLVGVFRVYEPFAHSFEQLLHKTFAHCRTHGEWFRLNEIELMWMTHNSCPFSINFANNGDIAVQYSVFPEQEKWMI